MLLIGLIDLDEEPSDDTDTPNTSGVSVITTMTGVNIKLLHTEIRLLRDELKELKLKVDNSKFCLSNIVAQNKVPHYIGFPSAECLNACYEFQGPAVNNLTYWNGSKFKEKIL